MTINQIQDGIIEDFEVFEDWMDKYEYIISFGKELPSLEEQYKTEDNIVKGCQSKVWLHTEHDGVNINFAGDSDAIITKGLVGLLIRVLTGHPAKEILDSELYFIDRIGLKEHLSPNRSNGLVSMVKQMKMYALAYTARQEG